MKSHRPAIERFIGAGIGLTVIAVAAIFALILLPGMKAASKPAPHNLLTRSAESIRLELGEAVSVEQSKDGLTCRRWVNQGQRWLLVLCSTR